MQELYVQIVERLTEELRGMISRLAALELATSQVCLSNKWNKP